MYQGMRSKLYEYFYFYTNQGTLSSFFFKECIHLKTECFQISLVMVLGLSKGKLVCLMIH